MSACLKCGTPTQPNDKFCNICGTPVARAPSVAPPPPRPANAYASPLFQQGGPEAIVTAPPPQHQGGGPTPAVSMPQQPLALPHDALRGFLVSYQSNTRGDFWPLRGGRLTVGRTGADANIQISLSDATISSRHAAFAVDAALGTVHVEDTGSTNGTYVNEEHLGFNGRRELRDGDRVRFGAYTTLVKIIHRI